MEKKKKASYTLFFLKKTTSKNTTDVIQYRCFDLSSFNLTSGRGPFLSVPQKDLDIRPPG